MKPYVRNPRENADRVSIMKYFSNPICHEVIDSFVAKLATEVIEDMITTEKENGWYYQLDELIRQNWWESCGIVDICFDNIVYNKKQTHIHMNIVFV